jgi:bla regulator protein blaR1
LRPLAQQQQFEIASVRPSKSDDPRTLLQVMPQGGMRTSGATVKFLLSLAHDVTPFEIVDGPGWISSERFDVIGKTETAGSSAKNLPDPTHLTAQELKGRQNLMRPKLQGLLAERFQLKLRHETRQQPVYALVVSKSGIRFRPTQGDFRGVHVGRNQLSGARQPLKCLPPLLRISYAAR